MTQALRAVQQKVQMVTASWTPLGCDNTARAAVTGQLKHTPFCWKKKKKEIFYKGIHVPDLNPQLVQGVNFLLDLAKDY